MLPYRQINAVAADEFTFVAEQRKKKERRERASHKATQGAASLTERTLTMNGKIKKEKQKREVIIVKVV